MKRRSGALILQGDITLPTGETGHYELRNRKHPILFVMSESGLSTTRTMKDYEFKEVETIAKVELRRLIGGASGG